MKYVFLFCGTAEQQQAWEKTMTREERGIQYEKVGRWFAEYSSKLGSSKQLQPPHTATTVVFQNGEPIVHDGPFIEGNEIIGGYAEVNVADLDEALRMAKTWPAGPVEIRPVMEMDQ